MIAALAAPVLDASLHITLLDYLPVTSCYFESLLGSKAFLGFLEFQKLLP